MFIDVQIAVAIITGLATIIGALLTALLLKFKTLGEDLQTVKTDCAVMKTQIMGALELRSEVKEDHDNLIRLQSRVGDIKEDVDALHESKRDILKRITNN